METPNGIDEDIFLINRHTAKPKEPGDVSAEYPGITPAGEEKVRERTRDEIMEVIESSAPGSVIVFGGATDLARTKSSSRVSGSELKEILAGKDEYLVLDETDINNLVSESEKGEKSTIHELQKLVAENGDKKVIINYPLSIHEFSMIQKDKGRMQGVPDWKTGGEAEKWTDFLTAIYNKGGKNEYKAVLEWVKSGGETVGENGEVLKGPVPEETAKGYVKALMDLKKVAGKLFPERPLVIQVTGHSWDIDVFITYLAHKGKISAEGLESVAKGDKDEGNIIGDFEGAVVKVTADSGTVEYRGKTYNFDRSMLE